VLGLGNREKPGVIGHIARAIVFALIGQKAGMGALSEAVYGNTQLPLRERESARWTIALINDCLAKPQPLESMPTAAGRRA